jgi:hypothetical protein
MQEKLDINLHEVQPQKAALLKDFLNHVFQETEKIRPTMIALKDKKQKTVASTIVIPDQEKGNKILDIVSLDKALIALKEEHTVLRKALQDIPAKTTVKEGTIPTPIKATEQSHSNKKSISLETKYSSETNDPSLQNVILHREIVSEQQQTLQKNQQIRIQQQEQKTTALKERRISLRQLEEPQEIFAPLITSRIQALLAFTGRQSFKLFDLIQTRITAWSELLIAVFQAKTIIAQEEENYSN